MACNNLGMDNLNRLLKMSVTAHLRSSMHNYLFCEQDTDICQFISWDVTGSDHSGSEEN
jgi:hypothetical protein